MKQELKNWSKGSKPHVSFSFLTVGLGVSLRIGTVCQLSPGGAETHTSWQFQLYGLKCPLQLILKKETASLSTDSFAEVCSSSSRTHFEQKYLLK